MILGFTVQAVTAGSGISLGSLYHRFGSFDGLAAALYTRCMADLLDTLIVSLERTRTARTGVRAVVVAYLRFAEEQPAKARFIHAPAYAGFLPARTAASAAAKAPRIERLLSWVRPHAEAGRIVDLPDPLTEMLLIGPVAETARRWLAGDPTNAIVTHFDTRCSSPCISVRYELFLRLLAVRGHAPTL